MSMKDRVHDEIAWNENSARRYSLMSLRRKIHLEVSKRLRALLASPEEPGLAAGTEVEQRLFYEHVQRFLLGEETGPAPAVNTEGLREAWTALRPWVVNLSDAMARTDVKRDDGVTASQVITDAIAAIDAALRGKPQEKPGGVGEWAGERNG